MVLVELKPVDCGWIEVYLVTETCNTINTKERAEKKRMKIYLSGMPRRPTLCYSNKKVVYRFVMKRVETESKNC